MKTLQKGQTTIEYVMLMAVVLVLVTTVLKSRAFQDYLGAEGEFFKAYKRIIEFSYRYGTEGNVDPHPDFTGEHPSYFGDGNTRFFGPLGEYPEN